MFKDDTREPAPLHCWLAMPMESVAAATIDRVRRAEDVVHVAVMPDVHLANDVCVGTAMATTRLIYPGAVGGDIGCGMLAAAFDIDADVLRHPAQAGSILRALHEAVPVHRRHRTRTMPLPSALAVSLSHPALDGVLKDAGLLQLGTLGGGNHFVEFQADGDGRLWVMIHTGSRVMGQAIKTHHLARATIRSASMLALDADANTGTGTDADTGNSHGAGSGTDADTNAGAAYLHDQEWARAYAAANRQAICDRVVDLLRDLLRVDRIESMTIGCDHNHVRRERHQGRDLYVHRKGAMPADAGRPGVVPGSMGTLSYHVTGLGCEQSLRSGAHGAGRLLSRHAARDRFNRNDLRRQMHDVWFDPRMTDALREESPKSYKDVRSVMAAQNELVSVNRILRPLLVYKGK